jgi:benzodiazapine receptor
MAISPTFKLRLALIGWLALVYMAAAIGALADIHADSFYNQLSLPLWAPPASWFGPVWTLLYALLGVAAWIVWRVAGFRAARGAWTLFFAQLLLNALWSWLFFGWHRGVPALVDILCLWILILLTLIAFWRVRPLAGALLAPYILWVSFAALLNYAVWQLNAASLR